MNALSDNHNQKQRLDIAARAQYARRAKTATEDKALRARNNAEQEKATEAHVHAGMRSARVQPLPNSHPPSTTRHKSPAV